MRRFPWTAAHSSKDPNPDRPSLDQTTRSKTKSSKPVVGQLLTSVGDGDASSVRTSISQSTTRSPATSSLLSFPGKSWTNSSVDHDSPSEDPLHPLPDETTRKESSARYLFNKSSRILKRKTSRRVLGQTRTSIKVIQNGLSSLDSKLSDSRPTISSPYGFQHLAHTSQDEFHGFNKPSWPDTISEIGDEPQAEVEVTGTGDVADSSPSQADNKALDTMSPPMSPMSPMSPIPATGMPQLPLTPPRLRQSLRRDEVSSRPETAYLPSSRSVENFSRLTRSPITSTGDFSPVSERSVPRLSGRPESASLESLSNWAEETAGTLSNVADLRHRSSNLPQIPEDDASQQPHALVHAVSTNDQSAVRLSNSTISDSLSSPKTAATTTTTTTAAAATTSDAAPDAAASDATPDATPATTVAAAAAAATEPKSDPMHERQSSTVLRHSQSFPSTTLLRRRSQSSGEMPLISSFAGITSESPDTIKSAARMSIGLKKIDVEDWEDAIDYAWDHPLDIEEDSGLSMTPSHSTDRMPWSRSESLLLVRQPSYDPFTQPSTPLMMQAPDKPLPIPDPTRRLPSLSHRSTSASLRGLGIASVTSMCQGCVTDSIASSSSSSIVTSKSQRESFGGFLEDRPGFAALPRDPASPMSKSSSQESIILSIASSIMSTCRSSNSSHSLGDIGELTSIDDKNGEASSRTTSAAIASKSVPGIPDAAEPSDSDGSQETIVSEAVSATVQPTPLGPQSTEERAQTVVRPMRSTSISEAFIPSRSSSIASGMATKAPGGSRVRSSTLTSRSRHAHGASRGSYSLFPTVQPASMQPSI